MRVFLLSSPLLLTFSIIFSSPHTVQVVLSTAHPAKFSEAVTRALAHSPKFSFERDVLPTEFHGLLEKERRVIDVEAPEIALVKEVIERFAGGQGVKAEGASV